MCYDCQPIYERTHTSGFWFFFHPSIYLSILSRSGIKDSDMLLKNKKIIEKKREVKKRYKTATMATQTPPLATSSALAAALSSNIKRKFYFKSDYSFSFMLKIVCIAFVLCHMCACECCVFYFILVYMLRSCNMHVMQCKRDTLYYIVYPFMVLTSTVFDLLVRDFFFFYRERWTKKLHILYCLCE